MRHPLQLATGTFVLGLAAQSTFLFFLVPAAARAAGAASFEAWAFAASALSTMALNVPAGRASDRRGRRPVMRAGYALQAVAPVPVAAALLGGPSAPLLLAASVLSGAGFGLFFVAFQSYIGDVVRRESLGASFGVTSALAILASALGPLAAGGLVAATASERAGLVRVSALLALLGAGAALGTYALPTARSPGEVVVRVAADRGLIVAVASLNLLMGLGYGIAVPYFASYFLDDVGLGSATWGALLGAATVASAVAIYFAGLAADRVPQGALLAGICGFMLVASLPLAFTRDPAVSSASYLARTFFAAAPGAVVNALLMARASRAERGSIMGAVSVAWNAAWATGAALGGAAMGWLGPWVFVLGGALSLASVAVGFALLPPAEPLAGAKPVGAPRRVAPAKPPR